MQETERLSAMPELPRQGRPGAHAGGAAERAGHDDQDRTSVLHQPPKIALFWVSTIIDDIPLDRYRLDHVCVYCT
jgi:hypothetical protein